VKLIYINQEERIKGNGPDLGKYPREPTMHGAPQSVDDMVMSRERGASLTLARQARARPAAAQPAELALQAARASGHAG